MHRVNSAIAMGASLVAILLGTARPVAAKPQAGEERSRVGASAAGDGVIDPRADAALHRMSDYLAGLRSFRVDTATVDEYVTTDGQKIQELKESQVAVKRPDRMSIERIGPFGRATLHYDGKQFTLYGARNNNYATAPAPANLDAAIDTARDRLGVDAPGGDLLVADPYASLIDGVKEGRYIGLEPIRGVMAHHLALTKDDVDWQIWIQDGPAPVPLRYVITSKDVPGKPQFTIVMHNWRADVPLDDASFTFVAPPGARRIDWATAKKRAESAHEHE